MVLATGGAPAQNELDSSSAQRGPLVAARGAARLQIMTGESLRSTHEALFIHQSFTKNFS